MVVRKATTIVALVIAALIALRPMFLSASPPPRITAELSAPRGTTADIFVWSIIAHDTSEVPPPTIERSEDFEVRYRGPQSSVQIVNGVVSRELRYVYNLVPLREGTLHTPKATVVAAGREFEVAPLDVEIEKALQGSAHHSHNGVTVEQTFDRTTVYVGQQLTNTIEILTSIQLIEPQFGDLTFDGFRQLDIGDDQRTTRFVRGRPTTVITLKKALYPIRTGELTIPGRELRAKIRSQATHRGGFPFDLSDPFGGGLLDDFFGGGSLKEIRVSSAPTTITVKPLPSSTAPIITWGAHPALVGHTGINVRLDEGPLPFGESRSFTVELTSEGNIAPITTLPFQESASYRIYQEPPETKVFDSDGTIVTRKNFKATLVPLKGGVLKVPPFKITYFDPNQGEYKTTSSREFSVEVSGGPAKDTTAPSAGAAPTSAPIVSAEPTYEPLSVLARLGKHISLSLALLILSCILGTIGLFYLRHLRRQRALPRELAWRAIERARTAEELRSGFQQALTTELGLSPETTVPRLRTAVKVRSFSADLEFTIESIFDTLDSMIYGRGEASDDLEGLRHRARAVRDALPRVS